MSDPERSKTLELVGELLATGATHQEIIDKLCEVGDIPEDEALVYIREVYDCWRKTTEQLELTDIDYVNWHTYLRKRLLQRALAIDGAGGVTAALRILDSLAALQNISVVPTQPVPLVVNLVPVTPGDEVDSNGTNKGKG